MRPSQTLYAILSFAFILMMGMGHLSAQVPSLLEYDGYMTGNITGNRTIGVKLYNASINGTLIYKETIGIVKVTSGEFYFQYGQNGSLGNGTTPTTISAVLTGRQNWLAVTVNGTEQTPRAPLLSVPFALKSADAQKTDADLRQVVDAVGKVVVAFGGNASNLVSNPAATIATMEKTAKNVLEMQKRFRVIGITGNLSFGNSSTTRQLVISNTGFDRLGVSGITCPIGFSGAWSGTIAPGASQNVTVTFTPTAAQAHSGNITVASDASSGVGTIAVSGQGGVGVVPPLANMVSVAGGTLPQGSGLAGQSVISFQIGKYEVTWGEWKSVRDWAVTNNKGYDLAGVGDTYPSGGADNFPVVKVSWYDVLKWINAKSEKEGKTPVYTENGTTYKAGQFAPTLNTTANGYRLPSEKEWEWATRGGVSSKGYTYSGSNTASEVAWTNEILSNGTKAVGTKAANELGIYDMSGNVFEWCEDVANTSYRRIRGGSWSDFHYYAYVDHRGTYRTPGDQLSHFGFRLARSSGN